ncbi:MAG TPA: hypothetical protein ENI05_09200 [Porticoccus sp.]|nr:hypothetical protein [Porticoccus sp.]
MKKGDLVTICDGSWTASVVDGKLIHESLVYGHNAGKRCVVIETGCSFPLVGDQPFKFRNDTVVQQCESGKVVFIYSRFLKSIPQMHTIIIDGKAIELSHESFLNLKEQLL